MHTKFSPIWAKCRLNKIHDIFSLKDFFDNPLYQNSVRSEDFDVDVFWTSGSCFPDTESEFL